MSNSKRNFYDVLNAASNATADELKSNYKQLILQCHPDKLLQQQSQLKSQSQSNLPQLENNTNKLENIDLNNMEFVAITEAWNCLKDPLKRKQYDAELLLNKFHTHNNIYAHIKLIEMKKQLNTGDYYDEDDDDDVEENEGEGDGKVEDQEAKESIETKVCNTSKYLYTYDCRCGGQYIVDESAEQHCRTNNHGSQISNSDNTDVVHNSVDDDDAADITQNNNNINNKNTNKNIEYKNNGGASASGSEGVVFNEDNSEEGGELIVECSECSLVIILNG